MMYRWPPRWVTVMHKNCRKTAEKTARNKRSDKRVISHKGPFLVGISALFTVIYSLRFTVI